MILHPEEHNSRFSKTIHLHWNITKGYRSPDGVRKLVYLVNDEFPGPIIEARPGDTLEIVVSNHLEDAEGVAIHWHGLHMRGANEMDGVVGITQDAIPAGEGFTYRYDLSSTQAGTFWYHSHSALQRSDGLYGGLVIHEPISDSTTGFAMSNYDHEELLLIGDWYHRSAIDVQASYLTFMSSGHEPVPDSLLLNGFGAFDCSMAVPSRPVECEHVQRPALRLRNGRTRLRVVNVGSMAGLNISIPNSKMEVVHIDGGNPINLVIASEVGILYPGERMDLILSSTGIENISIILDPELFTMQNLALTATQTIEIITPANTRSSHESTAADDQEVQWPTTSFDLSTAKGLQQQAMPTTANQTILIYTHIEMLAHYDHVPMAYMNRTNWIPQSPPLISIPTSKWDDHQFMPEIHGNGEWVDIIVNNLDKDAGHPFHLHGHDFYVLTRHAFPRRAGYRTYNPFDLPSDAALMYPEPNLVNPPLKDTVHIPRRGYVILRIRADNLGIWFFHCHVLWHAGTGMGMGFVVT
ncbi:uncharacterized protein LY89DRAFT_696478 [Mollisia scopiformis]|uniref:Laccase n=1 Tax=Mollisia scopiformis TaxID=149040 RepID=A0A194XCZ4_MOLSC|nr:uncharacterized protein LY89DRAFT_696478 [Mollisia scopiformis]KUJ18043.1 hypothetical protein LY89DRAFT_696478 [Mollisia scopiformis]